LKKPPTKVAQKNSNPRFSLTASTAQMAQTEEFMFQNVAFRPTVELGSNKKWEMGKKFVAFSEYLNFTYTYELLPFHESRIFTTFLINQILLTKETHLPKNRHVPL
jgi:hypothetical protein